MTTRPVLRTCLVLACLGVGVASVSGAEIPAKPPGTAAPAKLPASVPGKTPVAPPANATGAGSLSLAGAWIASSAQAPAPTGDALAWGGPAPVPAKVPGGVWLRTQDLLVGEVISLQAGKLRLASGAFGPLELAADTIAQVSLGPTSTARGAEAPPGFVGALLRNGEKIAGQTTFINAAQAGIDTSKRIVQIPRERVAMLVLAPAALPAGPTTHLRLGTGDRISGTVVANPAANPAAATWTVTQGPASRTIPAAAVRSWWLGDAARLPLTSLPLTASSPGLYDPPLVPVGVDQTAEGEPLTLGGAACDQGLMLPAGASVTVTIPTGYRQLVGVLAVTAGSATLRVVRDGAPVFDSGPRTVADGPRAVRVDLPPGKDLTLSAVSAAGAPARTVWGWLTLVR